MQNHINFCLLPRRFDRPTKGEVRNGERELRATCNEHEARWKEERRLGTRQILIFRLQNTQTFFFFLQCLNVVWVDFGEFCVVKLKLNKNFSLPWTPHGEKASENNQILLPRGKATSFNFPHVLKLTRVNTIPLSGFLVSIL